MHDKEYISKIKNFLESGGDFADYSLLIDGKWGVGKTYLWGIIQNEQEQLNLSQRNILQVFIDDFHKKNSFRNHFLAIGKFLLLLIPEAYHCLIQYLGFCNNKKQYKKFVYISLFGKEHYKQLLEEVLYKAYMRNKIILLFKKITLYGVSMESMLSLLTKDDLKNVVVCFDDIERKSYSLKIKDFLGLVLQLKEEKQCKVVLLSDTIKIQTYEKKYFDKYIEKVIDLKIEIIDRKEVIKTILNNNLKDVDINLMPNNIYSIINIRNLKRIIKGINQFYNEFDLQLLLQNDASNYKGIMIYLFECIVDIVDNDKKQNVTTNNIYPQERLYSQLKNIIKKIAEECWNGLGFEITEHNKRRFEDELKNYKLYTMMVKLQNMRINLINNDSLDNKISEYETIISSIQKNEIEEFTNIMLYEFVDFMALINIINSTNAKVKNIEKEIRKYVLENYLKIEGCTEQEIKIICNNEETLLQYADEIKSRKSNNQQITNSNNTNKISLKQLISNKISSYNAFLQHLGVLNDGDYVYSDDEIKSMLNNKIISFYMTYFLSYPNNEANFQSNYPRLYKIYNEMGINSTKINTN